MKKLISALAVVALALTLATGIDVKAAEVSGGLSGPSTAKAGETITLNLNVNSSICYGASGELSYDASKATVNSVSVALEGWGCDYSAPTFLLIDNNVNGVTGAQTILKVNVTLASNLAADENITFTVSNYEITYGEDFSTGSLGTVSHTVKIVAEPVADNNPPSSPSQGTTTPDNNSSSDDSSTSDDNASSDSNASTDNSTSSGSSTVTNSSTSSDKNTSSKEETKKEETKKEEIPKDDVVENETTGDDRQNDTQTETTLPSEENEDTKDVTSNVDDDADTDKQNTEQTDNDAEPSSPAGLIVGIIIAVVVVAAGAVWFFFMKKKKSEEQSEE